MLGATLLDNPIPAVQGNGSQWDAGRIIDRSGTVLQNVQDIEAIGPGGRRFFTDLHRPYFNRKGQACLFLNAGRSEIVKGERVPIREERTVAQVLNAGIQVPSFVLNATTLRKEEWLELDRRLVRAARFRLRAWADLSAANSFGGFNGMGKEILEYEAMSDPGEAMVDMDALSEGRNDAPKFLLRGVPLTITHSDFWFSARKLANSRNTGTPLDASMGEAAGRRVAESVEKTLIGNVTGPTYGGASTQVGGYDLNSTVFGYTNYTNRLTKNNFTDPSTGGWTPETTQKEINTALNQLRNNRFYGPFMIYHSNDWDPYLDGDYYVARTSGAVAPTITLRERIKNIDTVLDVRRLDFLFATPPSTDTASSSFKGPGGEGVAAAGNKFTFIFVQMTPDVCEAVNGLDMTTLQWESIGGMRLNFKVLCIQVPRLKSDFYGNCGILHGTTT